MKTTIKTVSFLVLVLAFAVGCAQRGDDAGTGSGSGSGGKQIDPPAESTSWACRSGVDAEGVAYMEFRPGYLNNGAEANAYIVGQAPGEGIVGYFTGSYVQESKDSGSSWYRYDLTGPEGSDWVLTYGRCVDTVGNKPECWAQYGLACKSGSGGPFCWNSSGDSYACKGKVGAAGKPAVPHGQ